MRHGVFGSFLVLLLTSIGSANTLRLEFVQEGDPSQPRALIVIHDAFEDRSTFADFFKSWSTLSWARDQYCSVYSYEYEGSGLQNLVATEVVAQDLYARLRADRFEKGRQDEVNPARRINPSDPRQPQAETADQKVQILLAGTGYGGLIARETSLIAKKDGRIVKRLAYLGTPLDGLSTIDLLLAFGVKDRAARFGLQPLTQDQMTSMSGAWWSLTDLFDVGRDWSTYFAPAHAEVLAVAAYGAKANLPHPTDNVLYGRHRRLATDEQGSDGFVPQPLAWGAKTGPVPWLKEVVLKGSGHTDLTKAGAPFLLKEFLDREIVYSYLARRQGIEEMIRGNGELPPLGTYFDERESEGYQPHWREAYATPKSLYEMMWGVGP